MVVFNEEKQDEKLDALRREEEEKLAQVLSAKYKVNYIDLTTAGINSDALRVVNEVDARAHNVAVFDIIDKKIKIAVLAPENIQTKKLLALLTEKGYIPTIYMTS
ncbi:MAG: hypothetical protein M3Q73_01230, partial [bacterium]|nr:hypothetical protein [bacterium]